MLELTLSDLARITGGRILIPDSARDAGISANSTVSGAVDTDSREITAGGIFVAKPGEFSDGFLFIDKAVAAGAALVIAERASEASVAQIIVDDAVLALGALATEVVRLVRERGLLRIVGITGSNGKTTTKNLLTAILERRGETIAPRDSFNNEVGAPLTMLKLTPDSQFLVAEMGASGPGEITRLVRMAKPDVGVVLTVGLAHAGEFGGIETTLATKTEMVSDLLSTDVAVLNVDDARVASMADKTDARVVWFGLGEGARVRATDISAHAAGTDFTITLASGESRPVHFRVLGEHHVTNALAAAAAAESLGVGIDDIVTALESVVRAERWRMEVLGGNEVVVINDAYNASPDSMVAGLKTLVQIATPDNRKVAVLGEMSELGEFALEEHDRIGRMIVRLGIEKLIVVGEGARALHLAATHEGSWDGESQFVATADEAYDALAPDLRPGDIVFVKSSNSAGLRFLGDRLGELFV
ncbi:UDP-N-acetylmuramoyl-tripeptide--D-alanyl-D-alanine ligase [Agreia sp. COWG]|uniref:UDP-N-acetylmuramoyl-tripeptide--D-alanyl-D- alanine ligase n=1 Tax=Agreia sp. COWG TaxID=2773266 RepID=UPI001927CEF4|nr:UDP-N-acetylmuramoyl-tripeptide--D-alanyl-D-alanine ligase [Agreia sp. COWG]